MECDPKTMNQIAIAAVEHFALTQAITFAAGIVVGICAVSTGVLIMSIVVPGWLV